MEIKNCAIVIPGSSSPEEIPAMVLRDEIHSRTGKDCTILHQWPNEGVSVAISSSGEKLLGRDVPRRKGTTYSENRPEGFRLSFEADKDTIWIIGADRRGCLYGVGQLLRKLALDQGSIQVEDSLDISSSPRYPIRGHQLGYRPTANSYDAWSPDQYEQYIRELAIFGANCVENIPFQDQDTNELMKLPRREMNRRISLICEKYDLDYWVWTPVTVDLSDPKALELEVEKHERLYMDTPRLDAVFVPGGDPGGNPPQMLLPFLEIISQKLKQYHPKAGVWVSLQGFKPDQVEYFFNYLIENGPDWLEGVVSGPSSPPIPLTREKLPERYKHRHYPDITHTVRCQYPVPWWDQAFALTLGREPCNPQPKYYSMAHNQFAPHTDGFLSYSDGVHDDLNKVVWTHLAWNPETPVEEIVSEYCKFFFGPQVEQAAKDGVFMLEKNWEGSLRSNEVVEETFHHWQKLEKENPQLLRNWRWQLFLLRAYYDAYTRRRLIYERDLEKEAMSVLREAASKSVEGAMEKTLHIMNRADTEKVSPDLRQRIEELCQ